MNFPSKEEYADFFNTYMQHLPTAPPLRLLQETHTYSMRFWEDIPQDKINFAYAPQKWTIKQLVLHLIDTEQILRYRALRFARNDFANVLSFDEDTYVKNQSTVMDWDYCLEALRLIRQSTIHFFKGITEEESKRGGSASFPCTVRAIASIIAAHELHHIYVVQERYLQLPKAPFVLKTSS